MLHRRLPLITALLATLLVAAPARAADTVPGEVVVKFRAGSTARAARSGPGPIGHPRLLHVRNERAALRRLRARSDVVYAVRNVKAHAAGFVPNDPGRGTKPAGWAAVQWNFAGPWGVNAPDAWQNLIAAGRPGGRGVLVAVLDTGVAYANKLGYMKSPDFSAQKIVRGYDFVSDDRYPYDKNGHGTHVASTIAESTNNAIGLTGLAYGVKILPVRVLDDRGEGDAAVIARGIRYAAQHGAQVINLSLEFSIDVRGSEIPELLDAVTYAHEKGAVVVGASGNEAYPVVAYPAKASAVISVGATTEHGCLSDFSNIGSGLDVVAPGGGPDAALDAEPRCLPDGPAGHDIYQITLEGDKHHRRFGIPPDYAGTSMATPHVSAIAALVIASGVLGAHPTPGAVEHRIEQTSRDLGDAGYDRRYGFGLVDAAAATRPGPPVAQPPPVR
jgi:serine protease